MLDNSNILTPEQSKLFKLFKVEDTTLSYMQFNQISVRKVFANNEMQLINWIKNKLIPDVQSQFAHHQHFSEKQLKKFEGLHVGDIVTWIEGYNCTLHQFAKVVKKTAKTVQYQRYQYRGMDCVLTLDQLVLTNHFFCRHWKSAITNLYNPQCNYDNNCD